MEQFNSFHKEDGITFCHESEVFFSQCNRNKVLSLHELLRLTSDIAVEDYRARGLSREYLLENHFAILVSRVAFTFIRPPKENERITLVTWEEKSEPLQLMRAYNVNAQNGEPLIRGLSSWLLVDPVLRKIIPTKQFSLREPSLIQTQTGCPRPGKISLPDTMTLVSERVISYSDLDANGHTNNARYGAFIEDCLPPHLADLPLKEVRINYAKEAVLGQKLSLLGNFESKKAFLVGKTEDGNTSFESELLFL